MLEDNSTLNYLNEEDSPETVVEEDKPDVSFLEGICSKCLNSGFIHTTKDGIIGVAFRIEGEDSLGHPIKRLLHCNHSRQG